MDRAMLLRILTVAVVAPYLYKVSTKETGYYSIGLKLLAGSLILTNVPQLLKDVDTMKNGAQAFIANLSKAQKTLAEQNAGKTVIDVSNAEEAEFTTAS